MWIGDSPAPLDLAEQERRFGPLIAFPGLINSHDHLAFNCFAPAGTPPYRDFLGWMNDVEASREALSYIEAIPPAARRQIGLLKNLLWGVTAVADHGGPAQPVDSPVAVLTACKDLHSPELGRRVSWLTGFGPVALHLAEGVSAESRRRALHYLGCNLWRRPVAGIHGVSLRDEDFSRLAALVWCPASNLFLFGRTANAAAAARRTTLLFGTDSTLSAPGTLWDHLRYARGSVREETLFAALTEAPVRFWQLNHRQDYVLARRRGDDRWGAFFSLTPDDILMVVRDGRPVLLDRDLAEEAPQGFHPVGGKLVRLPVPALMEAVRPHLDPATLISRFTGS